MLGSYEGNRLYLSNKTNPKKHLLWLTLLVMTASLAAHASMSVLLVPFLKATSIPSTLICAQNAALAQVFAPTRLSAFPKLSGAQFLAGGKRQHDVYLLLFHLHLTRQPGSSIRAVRYVWHNVRGAYERRARASLMRLMASLI